MANHNQKLEDLYSKLSIEDEDEGGIVVGADEEIVRKSTDEFPLVGRFLTEKNINFNAMQNVLAYLWRPKYGLEVHDLGEQRYAFVFYHILDIRKVLEGGPWSFEHNLLVLQQYSEGDDPLSVALEESDIWIQVYDLPKGFASENVLKSVGNYIGKFVKSDPNNFKSSWKSFLRIRVTLQVCKPLKRRMKIKREGGNWGWINFKYERLSTYCFVCGMLGHADRDCAVVYANPEKEVERAYGPWLRAPTRNAQVNTGAKWLRNSGSEGSSSLEYGGSSVFRSAARRDDLGPDFVEVDGVVREKSGVQSGIMVTSRNQGDREEFEIQNTDNDAGMDDVVVELKRKRMKGNTDGSNGPSHMIMDGPVDNTVVIYDSTKLEDNSKNLLGAGSVDQARLAQ